jgi:hypothetical protein
MADIDRVRLGVTFDEVAERYDRARPGCPPELFDAFADLAGNGPGCRVWRSAAEPGRRPCRWPSAAATSWRSNSATTWPGSPEATSPASLTSRSRSPRSRTGRCRLSRSTLWSRRPRSTGWTRMCAPPRWPMRCAPAARWRSSPPSVPPTATRRSSTRCRPATSAGLRPCRRGCDCPPRPSSRRTTRSSIALGGLVRCWYAALSGRCPTPRPRTWRCLAPTPATWRCHLESEMACLDVSPTLSTAATSLPALRTARQEAATPWSDGIRVAPVGPWLPGFGNPHGNPPPYPQAAPMAGAGWGATRWFVEWHPRFPEPLNDLAKHHYLHLSAAHHGVAVARSRCWHPQEPVAKR